jgi:hypothetical protein
VCDWLPPQNAFESWLHPDRYKTTLCSYAGACTRKFCFFAHSAAELRQPTNKQHSAAAAGGASCHPELRLNKLTSLDTHPSVGTPNSSSSSKHGMHISWVPGTPLQVSVGNNAAAAAAAAAAGMYVHQMQPMAATATGIPVSSCLAGGMYLPMYQGAAQQQQLMTAFMESSNNTSLLAGPPGLSAVVVTAPQLAAAAAAAGNTAAAAAAAPMQAAGGGFVGNPACVQLSWDGLTYAQLANLGTPMASDGSNFSSNSLLFDPASPSTPLTVNSMSPVHSPVVALPSMTNGNAAAGNLNGSGMQIGSSMQIGSLQHAFDSSSQQQQQHTSQLRQQLLQHLLNVQQQKQPQQQQQQQQNELPADVGSNWSLASVDANLAMMLNLNQQSLQLQQSKMTAEQAWPHYTLQGQQQQQQQQQQQAISGLDVQVLPGPQGFKPVSQASAGQQDLGCGVAGPAGAAVSAATAAAVSEGAVAAGNVGSDSNTAGFAGAGPGATQQLQQQLNLLSFAMAQPA